MVMRAHLRKTEVSEKILDYLTHNGGCTARQISDGTGIEMSEIVHMLQRLNGWKVKSKRENSSVAPKTWRLV